VFCEGYRFLYSMKTLIRLLTIVLSKSAILVGGQAVIEGVMMRVPGAYATAVRNPDGDIKVDRHEFVSKSESNPLLKKPIIRGIVNLFEAMKIGFGTLQWSADIAFPEEANKEKNKIGEFFATTFAIIFAIGLFMAGPYLLTEYFEFNEKSIVFNFIAGIFRITFFIIYLLSISLMKDVKRLFQYHGAEHKTIYVFESGQKLLAKNTHNFPKEHPRCGTSFLFIIMLVAIITFSMIDVVIFNMILLIEKPQWWLRLLLHLPLIPLVAGFGYEVLKLTAKYRNNILFRLIAKPGIWLQKITTSEPDDEQVEVAISALTTAFGDDYKNHEGQKFVAEAIG